MSLSEKNGSPPYFYFRFGFFFPYSGLHCRRIAHGRLEMLSVRKPGAPNLNLQPGSTFKSARYGPKCCEIDRNSKNACKKSSWSNLKSICKTESSCVLWPTFVQIGSRGRWVKKLGRRHISTSGLAFSAIGTLLIAVFCLVCLIAHRLQEMLPISKHGATNLNVWTGSRIQKPEVLSKMPEIVWNVVKLTAIRKTLVKSRRGQTWSGFANRK